MFPETTGTLIRNALKAGKRHVSFVFQGGEPTLCGLEYYKRFIAIVAKYRKPDHQISYSIQTNGVLVHGDWVTFLKEHDFLVGLSLDGTQGIHNDNLSTNGTPLGVFILNRSFAF